MPMRSAQLCDVCMADTATAQSVLSADVDRLATSRHAADLVSHQTADGVEIVQVTEEDEYFPPPRNLRDLISTIDAAATLALGGPVDARPTTQDRSLHASDVLASLA